MARNIGGSAAKYFIPSHSTSTISKNLKILDQNLSDLTHLSLSCV